jgi:hypothetical protein
MFTLCVDSEKSTSSTSVMVVSEDSSALQHECVIILTRYVVISNTIYKVYTFTIVWW